MDAIFGGDNFRNEITWKRTTTHSDSKTWSRVSDIILFYSKSKEIIWNTPRDKHSDKYIEDKYRGDDGDGRRYQLHDMTSPSPRPNMMYEWRGFSFPKNGWRFSKETMQKLDQESRIRPTMMGQWTHRGVRESNATLMRWKVASWGPCGPIFRR